MDKNKILEMAQANMEVSIAIVIIVPLFFYFYGVYLGSKQKIVVFRSLSDFVMTGLICMAPITVTILLVILSDYYDLIVKNFGLTAAIVYSCAIIFILVRTWNDNNGFLHFLIAIYVKIPTSLLFFYFFMGAFNGEKRSDRRNSWMWTVLMLPLIYKLIKDKSNIKMPRVK